MKNLKTLKSPPPEKKNRKLSVVRFQKSENSIEENIRERREEKKGKKNFDLSIVAKGEWKSSGVAEVVLPRVYRLGTRFAQETSLHSSPPFPSPFSANLRFPLPVPQPVPLLHPTPQPPVLIQHSHPLSFHPSPSFLPLRPFLAAFQLLLGHGWTKKRGADADGSGEGRGGGRVETKESRDVYVCVNVYTSGMEVGEAYISFFYGRVEWRGFGERIGTTWIDGKGCWSIVVTFPFSFFRFVSFRTERNKVLFNPVGSKVGQEGL